MARRLEAEGAVFVTWSMPSRHVRLVREMQHGTSLAAGTAPTAHALLASVCRLASPHC